MPIARGGFPVLILPPGKRPGELRPSLKICCVTRALLGLSVRLDPHGVWWQFCRTDFLDRYPPARIGQWRWNPVIRVPLLAALATPPFGFLIPRLLLPQRNPPRESEVPNGSEPEHDKAWCCAQDREPSTSGGAYGEKDWGEQNNNEGPRPFDQQIHRFRPWILPGEIRPDEPPCPGPLGCFEGPVAAVVVDCLGQALGVVPAAMWAMVLRPECRPSVTL